MDKILLYTSIVLLMITAGLTGFNSYIITRHTKLFKQVSQINQLQTRDLKSLIRMMRKLTGLKKKTKSLH